MAGKLDQLAIVSEWDSYSVARISDFGLSLIKEKHPMWFMHLPNSYAIDKMWHKVKF